MFKSEDITNTTMKIFRNYLLKQNISNEEMSMWFELATEVAKDIRVVEQILPSVYNCVDCNNKEIKD